MTMISRIGNKQKKPHRKRGGFSFFEVMVAAAVLSSGIVLVYKSFFTVLNFSDYLTRRLYAANLINNKIVTLQKVFEASRQIPFRQNREVESLTVNNKTVRFTYTMNFFQIENLKDIYQVDVILSWNEGTRDVRLSRSAYVANFAQDLAIQ